MAPVGRQNRFRPRQGRSNNGNPQNRVYDSAGPDGKVRGTPQQIAEKYQLLSRDAATAGDHVAAESYLQHAEHYARMVINARRIAQQRREERMAENAGDMRGNGEGHGVDASLDGPAMDAAMDRDGDGLQSERYGRRSTGSGNGSGRGAGRRAATQGSSGED